MSTLLDIQDEIQRTNEAVARAERAVANHPMLLSAQATLRGFAQLRDRLQAEFEEAAAATRHDVCRYAIETDDPMPAMSDIAGVWETFQRLFTAVYDVIVNKGPKQRERISDAAADATRFGFAYTFEGSIGVVMTVDQGPGLIPNTALDDAMKSVFEIMGARRPEEIIEVNRRFGLATVKIVREWAADNARARFGANVEWRGASPTPQHFRIQTPEIIQLESAIDRAAEHRTEEIEGDLIEVNYEERTFQMRTSPSKQLISGTYDDAISLDQPAQVPSRYRAHVRVSRRILSQGDEDQISYFLVRLDPGG